MADQPRGAGPKRARKRPARAPTITDRIYQDDFDRVKPSKIVPGVVGRSAWFAERAGKYEQSMSVDRLVHGTAVAEQLLDADAPRRRVADDVAALLDRLADGDAKTRFAEPALLGADGRRRSLTDAGKGSA